MERTVKKYNKVLKELMVQHRAYDKLELLYSDQEAMSPVDFQLIFNKWESEVICSKHASENQ